MEGFSWECSTKVRFGNGVVSEYLSGMVRNLMKPGTNVMVGYGGGSVKKNGAYDDVMRALEEAGFRPAAGETIISEGLASAREGSGADTIGADGANAGITETAECAGDLVSAACICEDQGAAQGGLVIEFPGIMSNPTLAKMKEGARLARENNVGLIIAIGGGSVMDCCKAAAVQARYDGDAWNDFWMEGLPMKHDIIPCGAVVTMPATGSEVNGCAVLTNEETRIKCDRDYPEMNPAFALMDPSYTLTMPLRQMRAGTFDILSHIMETYFSYPLEDNPADDISEALMRGLIRDFRAALKDPQDLQARSNIMWTASLAENRIIKTGKTKDFQAHNMEHQLSAYTDCNHGEGLAVLHPVYYRHIYKDGLAKFVKFAVRVWGLDREDFAEDCSEGERGGAVSGDFNSSAGGADSRNGGGRCSAEKKCGCFRPENQDERLALAGIECLENFIREAGLPASLRELGFSEEDREKLGEIAESCFISQGAFRPLTTAEIKEIYEECW